MLKKNNLFYDTISQHVLNVLNGSMLTGEQSSTLRLLLKCLATAMFLLSF